MSRSLSTTLYLRPGSISIYGNFYLCCLYHFRLFFGLWIVQIWSINYAWRFGSVKIHNHCLYWRAFVLTWAEILFSTVCYFYSYYWWSVNYTSRVIKFHNFFLTCSETEAKGIFEDFFYCHLWIVPNFPVLFLAFFHLVCKLFNSLFKSLFVS